MNDRKKIKVYIAGPMRGKPSLNKEAFAKAEKHLSSAGVYEIHNPSKTDEELGMTEEELCSKKGLTKAMERDLLALCKCEGIYMLLGWEKSEGARVEHGLATMLSMMIIYQR